MSTRNQKEIALLPTSESSAILDPVKPPERFMGFWQLRMYTQESPIYIPECAPAVGATRSAVTHFHELQRPFMNASATWFLVWWLFLHRRLRPRQRGPSLSTRATSATPWRVLSKGRDPFLSGRSRKPNDLILASLSASTWGVNRDHSRLPSLSNRASPLCSPLPWSVTCP